MLFQKELPRIFQALEVSICKAFKDEAVVRLLQVFNNATNGCLRERPKGEIFSAFLYYPMGYKLPPPNFLYFMSNIFIVIHLLIVMIKFHEVFGLNVSTCSKEGLIRLCVIAP